MKTEDTVEYNSLRWVKKELDLILQEAQTSLSAYIEDTEDSARLREAIEHLHMVQGTLQMVELYGAAQLAEEMEKVSEALLNGRIEKLDDAYDVLMRSMLQLPDYLESLQSGSKDVPMVLLPLLNDLRASRNASLLSESVLFFPDVSPEADEADTAVEAGQLLLTAKKLRPHFQIGLVGWFKGEKVSASLKRIMAVLGELEKKSPKAATRRVWSISSALIEGLTNNGIDTNVSIKMLLGQVDRSIKQLIDTGEDDFARKTPTELLKNLLYYVARVKTDSPRVKNIKTTYRLEELLPADSDLEEARSGMGGLNTELLSTVSAGIREDLLEVKDALEIFVHSDAQDIERLKSLPDLLAKIADTLSMLGLGMPREQVMSQQKLVSSIISGAEEPTDEIILNMAGVLLSVESQLNSFIANRSSMGTERKPVHRVGDLDEMPESEYQEVLSAVIKEGLQDFNQARQAILSYLESPDDKSLLELVIDRLDEVNGAMFMLPIQKLKHQIDSLRNYVAKVMLNAGQVPDETAQNDLADVVTSIEYYLEAVLEGRPDLELSMNSGNLAADRLNELTAKFGSEVKHVPAVESVKAEPVAAKVNPEVDKAKSSKPAEKTAAGKPVTTNEKQTSYNAVEEQRFVILGDDADEEILEIFIEEALEVLESLNEQVPLWSRDHANEEALVTIRRSFHTLKGSGRLIGAELIGEFSWHFENMLNRVIDKSRPLTQDVFDILDEALSVLPQLIEQLSGNQEPIPNVYELIDKADALGKWKKPAAGEKDAAQDSSSDAQKAAEENINLNTASSAPVTETVEAAEISETSADIELDDLLDLESELDVEIDLPDVVTSAVDSDDEMMTEFSEDELYLEDEVSLAEDDSDSLVFGEERNDSDEAATDDFDIDLTDELEALQIASSDDEDEEEISLFDLEAEIDLDETDDAQTDTKQKGVGLDETLQIYIDPVLFDIFKNESESHLKQIRKMIERHDQAAEPLTASADLLRALHTLYGSARTAEVDEIAELCGGLEKYVRLYLERDMLSISDSGVKLVDDVSNKVAEMLGELSDKNQRLESDPSLLQRIAKLSQEVQLESEQIKQNQLKRDQASASKNQTKAPEQAPADEMVSYFEVDDELVDIFLEEAEELLDNCENSLQRWNANNNDEESVLDLQRHLHTLKGGARMADLSPVGNLTHALESLVLAVNDGRVAFNKDMSGVLHESLDQLSDMLSKVKNREPISSAESLISHIDALRQGKETTSRPTPTLSDEDEDPEPAAEASKKPDVNPAADTLLTIEEDETTDDNYEIELSEESVLSDSFSLDEEIESAESSEDEETVDISQFIDDEHDLENLIEFDIDDDQIDEIDLTTQTAPEKKNKISQDEDDSILLIDESDEDDTIDIESLDVESVDIDTVDIESFDTDSINTQLIDIESAETKSPKTKSVDVKSAKKDHADVLAELITQDEKPSAMRLKKADAEKTTDTPQPREAIANEQVRVRSDLLNELVNHAGEVSVYHARMGQQVTNFSFNLSEMDQTVIRLREQLRKLSNETEAQILSRYEKETDQYGEDFDPLEMDRFSTMQQISRSLQETVGDIESITNILAEDVRDSETLLLQESRVSTELQEGLMRTRMVHFGGLASRLRRIVRQTARELDKDVELDITGETSEVDRTVLDRIVAPLEHMLRNAVSHGIEMPDVRVAAGKSATGHLNVTVDREGGDVVILVKDDGRGIDVTAVRKKAAEKGMLDANSKLSDHDVLQYIMEPGFSTAEKVTQISGRGVGMDVVDSEIKQLGGVLEIDTVQGKGTVFKIRLPLTLAINHALLVSVGDEIYAVPLNSIEGVVRLSGPELQQFYDSGERNYQFAGSSYELRNLGYLLSGTQADYSRDGQLFPVLLARAGDQSIALHVDELIGRREIVVKPVGAQISTVRGISGATILGDGRVVLILEMKALALGDALFRIVQEEGIEAIETPAPVKEEEREKLVMVVDDSITIRKVTERMLTRHNMKVVTAKDGIDAVSQLQEIMPDVMLLDIEMPRMDGYEVASHVRNDPRLKDLPIIMITSRSGSKHRDKAMELGVNKYLGKPYQEDDLMQNIHELIG